MVLFFQKEIQDGYKQFANTLSCFDRNFPNYNERKKFIREIENIIKVPFTLVSIALDKLFNEISRNKTSKILLVTCTDLGFVFSLGQN